MKTLTKTGIALGVVGTLAGTLAFAGQALAAPGWAGGQGPRTPTASGPVATAPAAVADAELAADLAWMREEERLARDVYAALASRYGDALPFSRITRSEQQHVDAMGTLLTRYGVADPSAGRTAGSYAEPELQALYDRLMAQGATSLADAYDVGIAIERADIADLDEVLARTAEADVTRVLSNLRRASEQHLAAFEAAKAGTPLDTHDGTGMGPGNGMRLRDGSGTGGALGQRAGSGRGTCVG